jgi:hypothetical protein
LNGCCVTEGLSVAWQNSQLFRLQQVTPRLLVGTDKSVTRLASKLTKLHNLLLLTPL